jgi:molybdenum cofactor biosynthesis enzyme
MENSLKSSSKRVSLASTQGSLKENTLKTINDEDNKKNKIICRICLGE